MQLESEDIAGFFDAYGWRYERESDELYRTGFVGETGHYEIWIRISEHWVYFTINPFVRPRPGEQVSDAVLELLLRTNHDLNLAKLALDDEGDVLMTVELPVAEFSYSHFADALTALSHYADLYRTVFDELMGEDEEDSEVV
jgi:hypothetical protein